MEGSTGAPPQRVCPQCARISWATGPRCPYCTERFSQSRRVTPWMLAGTAGGVLLGVLLMFIVFGQIIEGRVNDRIAEINKDFEADLNALKADVKKELDARLPAAGLGSAIPTPAPVPSITPEGEGAITPAPSPTVAPPTEGATVSPTETPTSTPTISP